MVRFVVEDYDKTSKNDFVGQYILPLSCMQQGKALKRSPTLYLIPSFWFCANLILFIQQ